MWLCRCIYISKGTIAITEVGNNDNARQNDEKNKGVTLKIVLHLLNA